MYTKEIAPGFPRHKVIDHERRWQNCVQCELGSYAFRHVFWRGQVPSDVVFIGEAPGEAEDTLGLPFVGPAGNLLNLMLDWTMDETGRFTYSITNCICCRPPGNRTPTEEEQSNCSPRLEQFLQIAEPNAVVALGQTAIREYPVPLLKLPHPAYILRLDQSKRFEVMRQCITMLVTFLERNPLSPKATVWHTQPTPLTEPKSRA